MRKVLFFICLALISCKKYQVVTTNTQGNGKISFFADGQAVVYSGPINQRIKSGVTIAATHASSSEWIYFIFGGTSVTDNLFIDFVKVNELTSGPVDFTSLVHIAYQKGDSVYVSGSSDYFSVTVSSYLNKILNGTFSGVLKTNKGTPIKITNGTFVDVPTSN